MIQGKHIIEPTDVLTTGIRTEYTFEVDIDARLSEIFNLIPNNSIINKGRCGIGGTYLEAVIAERNSIIVVPTNAIIDNKCFDEDGMLHENYYPVRGKFVKKDFAALNNFMLNRNINKTIFCTPESLGKITKCGFPLNELYTDWFILFDEAHTTITDNFRKNILSAFDYFFDFENKALISATPYKFSSPKLARFDRYTIGFSETVNDIEIHHAENVLSLLQVFLNENFSGRVHVFLNSVNEIANAVKMAEIIDCSIYCKYSEENMDKLDELRGNFRDVPNDATYSKFNFYTSKYFEGWDMHDSGATIIIVSDTHNISLQTGVSNKCIQAAGRNRVTCERIIHLTTDRNTLEFDSFEKIEEDHINTATSLVNRYNEHNNDTFGNKVSNKRLKEALLDYGNIEETTGIATYNDFKVDQLVNRFMCFQEYNHINYIKSAWENGWYNVKCLRHYYVPNLDPSIKNKKTSHKIQEGVKFLEMLEKNTNDEHHNFKILEKSLPIDLDPIRKYYDELGGEKMRELGYDPIKIRTAYRKSNNERVKKFIVRDFLETIGDRAIYKEEFDIIVHDLYVKYGVLKPNESKNIYEVPKVAEIKRLFIKTKTTKTNGITSYKFKKCLIKPQYQILD
ncbi:hypothetical protein [Pedobacter sp. AJM]|uniref:hypothetical protein n=1 Tax=Pedobacter sp. AJM TaxID=2003629 RepID=UPI000B4B9E5E|nr:hypothetical protein [Pedobacter sp. AJM]OWK71429.1 hypothetical protein CBW18_10265 [Pedobacter sp. AJM]